MDSLIWIPLYGFLNMDSSIWIPQSSMLLLFPLHWQKMATKVRDFPAKMSSIQEKMSTSAAHSTCSFFQLWAWGQIFIHAVGGGPL